MERLKAREPIGLSFTLTKNAKITSRPPKRIIFAWTYVIQIQHHTAGSHLALPWHMALKMTLSTHPFRCNLLRKPRPPSYTYTHTRAHTHIHIHTNYFYLSLSFFFIANTRILRCAKKSIEPRQPTCTIDPWIFAIHTSLRKETAQMTARIWSLVATKALEVCTALDGGIHK